MFEPEISVQRRLLATFLFIVVALGALITSYLVFSQTQHFPRTTDASVEAEIVQVAAGLPGRIAKLAVRENESVDKGQLLFKIENTAYQLLRDQAAAQLDATIAALADATRLSKAGKENANTATDEIDRAQNNLKLAEATVTRLKPLAADGITSKQTLDVALTAVSDAQVSLKVAKQSARSASYLVKSTDALQAEVKVAKAALALAEHNLSHTEIRAPFDGKVTGLKVSEGSWVVPELPIFTLINTQSWHVVGFFRETDLAAISTGQAVRVRVQSNPDIVLKGKVDSIAWGVLSTDGLTLQGVLPFVPTSTDWVRLAKRFPVRVSIDSQNADWLRMGASATLVLQPIDAKRKEND